LSEQILHSLPNSCSASCSESEFSEDMRQEENLEWGPVLWKCSCTFHLLKKWSERTSCLLQRVLFRA